MGEEAGNQVRLGRGRIKSGSLSRITHLVSEPDQWSPKRAQRQAINVLFMVGGARGPPWLFNWLDQSVGAAVTSTSLRWSNASVCGRLEHSSTSSHSAPPTSQDGKTNIFEMLNWSLLQLRWARRDGPSLNGRLTGKVPGTNLIDSKGINWRPDGHSYDKAAPAPRKLRIFTFIQHPIWNQENHVRELEFMTYDL